ncbi:transcriptional regulator [Escherichia coli]|uniref:PapB/FocB family fimbrial expression transcriptional regulator n=1 Tax=Escherichia TaxID=561 RepID=UPI0005A6920C|nr:MULTISPECIES: PapB/FocB family fimbrial expression transcriptional regulator [Escherichia]EFA4272662.1 transcriptional regulator [Escherichia coli O8]HBM2379284.1 transcriptional regulator [Salmonella enterica subsp. enterica serovar Heidelberg]EFA4842485.1 transcriptional regulator [Escherichia coli]EFH5753012.1 transcriptional regulator [Escherichia coli]EFN9876043.1 transcriptional regulator [Escherichia coli]
MDINNIKEDTSLLFTPGGMPEDLFWLLIELSPIHSDKIIMALRDFLVSGIERRLIYKNRGISAGYFSGALGRFQRTSFLAAKIARYYK